MSVCASGAVCLSDATPDRKRLPLAHSHTHTHTHTHVDISWLRWLMKPRKLEGENWCVCVCVWV